MTLLRASLACCAPSSPHPSRKCLTRIGTILPRHRRQRRSIVAQSTKSTKPTVNAVDFMDSAPTPWYKRDFDVHIAQDKGLGSVVLLLATALSLFLANSALSGGFIGFWEHFHFGPKSIGLYLNAHEWVNGGLMALFFFNVGLEIKREIVYGSLSNFRAALLPCIGALGGMIAPMGIYLLANMAPGGVPAGLGHPHGDGHRVRDGRVQLFQEPHAPRGGHLPPHPRHR